MTVAFGLYSGFTFVSVSGHQVASPVPISGQRFSQSAVSVKKIESSGDVLMIVFFRGI